ncbi:MAG: disulfide bond formation protein B, partial [Porticoccaceae bacterium]|nr:disulfide bond formation protein B [Porticoccaceae bacterium]
MVYPNNRTVNFLIALGCGGALLIAVLYFQEHLGLEPC